MNVAPCDWDSESHCVDCHRPAAHQRLLGMVGDTPVTEYVCCLHSIDGSKSEVESLLTRLRDAAGVQCYACRQYGQRETCECAVRYRLLTETAALLQFAFGYGKAPK